MCEIMIAFILGGDTEMVSSQLLRAREGCAAYRFLFRTSGHFNCGIHGDRSCKIQLTIAYSLLHLTRLKHDTSYRYGIPMSRILNIKYSYPLQNCAIKPRYHRLGLE